MRVTPHSNNEQANVSIKYVWFVKRLCKSHCSRRCELWALLDTWNMEIYVQNVRAKASAPAGMLLGNSNKIVHCHRACTIWCSNIWGSNIWNSKAPARICGFCANNLLDKVLVLYVLYCEARKQSPICKYKKKRVAAQNRMKRDDDGRHKLKNYSNFKTEFFFPSFRHSDIQKLKKKWKQVKESVSEMKPLSFSYIHCTYIHWLLFFDIA